MGDLDVEKNSLLREMSRNQADLEKLNKELARLVGMFFGSDFIYFLSKASLVHSILYARRYFSSLLVTENYLKVDF